MTPVRPDGEELTTRDMPINLPDGWDYEKVFGSETAPAARRTTLHAAPSPMLAMAATAPAADAATTGLALPQTSTDAATMITRGLLVIMLTALLAIGLWLQRQWRRPADFGRPL